MKLTVILIILFVVPSFAIDSRKLTLSEWYQEVKNNVDSTKKRMAWNNQFKQYFEGFSEWHIKNSLNFERNKNKELNFAEAMILIYAAGLKNFPEQKHKNAWNAMVDSLVDFYKGITKTNEFNCFKLELNKIDPNSSPLKLRDDSKLNEFIEECKSIVDMSGFNEHIANVEAEYGNLSTLTGGAIDKTKFKRIMLTFVVLGGESSYKMYSGSNKLIEELKEAMDVAFQAILNRLEHKN